MNSRSTFVSVLAWLFIIGSGFASLISFMQIVMLSIMTNGGQAGFPPDDAPGFLGFLLNNIHLFFYGFSAVSICIFVSSIGLLKRKNWARVAFIGILSFGILWQFGGIAMQFVMFEEMPGQPGQEGVAEVERMSMMIRWFGVAIGLGLAGFFAWVIKRLITQPVRAEFS